MSTYTQNLSGTVGGAVTTVTMDRVARPGTTVKHILKAKGTGGGDDTYTCARGEEITMVKAIGNATADDVKFKYKDYTHSSAQTTIIEESDSMIGPFIEVAVPDDDDDVNSEDYELVLYINKN
tara:strand:+ start:7211 stop:7579 length:369 start_codon:yes stop_codon:yes gene_type:complete